MSRVSLANPFDLLTDENEDRTNVPSTKKEQKPAAPAKSAAKPAATNAAAKPAAKPEAKAPAKPAEAKPAPKPAAGNAKPAAGNAKPAAGNSTNQVVKPAPPRDSNQNLQERDKETRAPRDKRDRPPRPPVEGGKRVFDRKSGTGRPKNEVTRGGHGKGNWGGETDAKEGTEALKDKEEKVEEKEEGDETKEEKPAKEEGDKKEGEPAKEGEAPVVNREEETLTYEEYLKTRKAKAPQVEALKPRTVTDADFGGFVALQREDAPKKTEKKEKAEKAEKAEKTEKSGDKNERNLAAKLLTFASHQDVKRQERGPYRKYDDRRGGDDRRGPRGPRGPGPRPDHQANPSKGHNSPASQPPEQKDFPALGPHGTESVKA